MQEPLEAFEAGEVEVVGGLVEQEHVEAGEQDRGEAGPGRLPARQRRHLEVERCARGGRGRRAPRRCARRSRPRRARGSRRARRAYASSAPGRRRRRAPGSRASSALLGGGDPRAAREVRAHRLARAPFGLLREVADGRGRRRARDLARRRARRGRRGSAAACTCPVPLGATTPIRLRGPTVTSTRSSTTCGPNDLVMSRATRLASELARRGERGHGGTCGSRAGREGSGRAGSLHQRARIAAMDRARRPGFAAPRARRGR